MELASNTPYTLKLASTIEMESQKVDPTRAYLPSRLLKNEEGTPEEIWNELLCIKCGRLPLTPMMCRGCQAVLCATCRYISCPNCQIKGWIKEISEEKQGDFAEIMVDCKYVGYGCKLLSKLSGLLLHERECKYAPTQCRLCGKLIPQVGYAQHLNICPSKVVTCDLCNGKFLLQDMPTHNHLKTLLSQIGNHRNIADDENNTISRLKKINLQNTEHKLFAIKACELEVSIFTFRLRLCHDTCRHWLREKK